MLFKGGVPKIKWRESRRRLQTSDHCCGPHDHRKVCSKCVMKRGYNLEDIKTRRK
jgi:hypothetical protein